MARFKKVTIAHRKQMFRLKLLVFLLFKAISCTNIWLMCNLPVPLHRKFKFIKRNEEIIFNRCNGTNGFKFNFRRWHSHQH